LKNLQGAAMINIEQTLITIIEQHLPQSKIFLFGSRARNTHKEGADYDIAIDNGAIIDRDTWLNLTSAIEESDIPVNVDIIDLNNVSTSFISVIKKDLTRWK
jgi:predicted nucleotidyltransferase